MDLTILSAEDIEYIAQIVPLADFRSYCKANKKFSTIHPGFRASTLSATQKEKLIREKFGKANGFIEHYLSLFLQRILKQISDAFQSAREEQSEEIAWLNTVSRSFFAKNPPLLRKLLGDEAPVCSYDAIEIAAIDILDSLDDSIEKLSAEKRSLEQESTELKTQLHQNELQINELTNQYQSSINYKIALLQQLKELEVNNGALKQREKELIAEITQLEKDLSDCKNEIGTKKKSFDLLQTEKSRLILEVEKLKAQFEDTNQQKILLEERNRELELLNSELTKQINDQLNGNTKHNTLADIASSETVSLIPQNIEDFKEIINYILEDCGIDELREVLINHLVNTLFVGKPIVACRSTAEFLKYVLSHIYYEPITSIVYSDSLCLEEIISQIAGSGRIVYMDNFVGNYAETYLIPFFPAFRNKIIIFSAAYDAMFKYVSDDFLQYVSYINLERYFLNGITTIEPEKFVEVPFQIDLQYANEKAVTVFEKRLQEIGFSRKVISSRIQFVKSHTDVQGYFLFEFIPYCVDVLGRNPFHQSQSLVAYFEKNSTANRWFKK